MADMTNNQNAKPKKESLFKRYLTRRKNNPGKVPDAYADMKKRREMERRIMEEM